MGDYSIIGQYTNGNQIVNLYDAAGRKYRSVTYTLPATAVTPIYEIAHYNFSIDTIHFDVTEYTGNIERRYSRTDTTLRVFNTIGYCQDDTFFYAIKDHLGNTSVMVNATTQLPVQSTVYYASGVQMAQSWGKDRQPYLYNGKEFIEAHGYNTYDYGFRGYYATTGRFTSVDPLAEQTPWQSPYTYANNNSINNIDWMGLSGMMSGMMSGLHYTELNNGGIVINHVDNGDNSVMLNGKKIGTELDWEHYIVGFRVFFKDINGFIFMYYDFERVIRVTQHAPLEERVAKWLKAKNVDEIEKILLKYSQPVISEAVLCWPIIGQINSIKILATGENIYGQQADGVVDYAFAIIGLVSSSVKELVPIKDVKISSKYISSGNDLFSFSYGLSKDYEDISQETP